MVCAISLKGSCQLAQVILNAARKYLPEHACPPFCTCSRIPKWVLHRLNYPPTQADYLSFFNEQTEKGILSPTGKDGKAQILILSVSQTKELITHTRNSDQVFLATPLRLFSNLPGPLPITSCVKTYVTR